MLLSLLSKRSLEIDSRDSYGFALRPQHAQKYREYASIYKEEEGERSDKWRNFLEQISISSQPCFSEIEENTGAERTSEGGDSSGRDSAEGNKNKEHTNPERAKKEDDSDGSKLAARTETKEGISPKIFCERDDSSDRKPAVGTEDKEKTSPERLTEGDDSSGGKSVSNGLTGSNSEKEVHGSEVRKTLPVGIWAEIRPSLIDIDKIMSYRVKKGKNMKGVQINGNNNHLPSIQDSESVEVVSEDCKDDVCVNKTFDDSINDSSELFYLWKEMQFLVQGGVPKDIRGEVWQAFVGVKTRRVESYYENLLAQEIYGGESKEQDVLSGAFGKWRKQIEKVISCTRLGLYFDLTCHELFQVILLWMKMAGIP